ncbi:MAG: hypothetical protein MR606_02945 [Mollicutes bacterium]|nr:hypothetical protein [Mollicutes bacterium]MDD7264380.1 hypothetical protein [bacterium]MDY4979710.1 hypothetical protein [Candidatus Onthovivens sp.]
MYNSIFLVFILEILAFIELIKNCIDFFKCIKGLNIRGIIDGIIKISIYLIVFIFLLYNLLKILRFTIILNKTNIYIYSDFYSKKNKVQYYTSVSYKDIKSIEIIWSNRNSIGENSGNENIFSGDKDTPYLKIITKQNEEHLFLVMFTSKRTLKNLIDELKIRMKKCGNIAQIEATENIIKSIIW